MTASHEHCQVGAKKVIPHPTIGLAYCEKSGYEVKTCDLTNTHCGETTKTEELILILQRFKMQNIYQIAILKEIFVHKMKYFIPQEKEYLK